MNKIFRKSFKNVVLRVHNDTDGKWPNAFNFRIFKFKEQTTGETFEVKLYVSHVEKRFLRTKVIGDMEKETPSFTWVLGMPSKQN